MLIRSAKRIIKYGLRQAFKVEIKPINTEWDGKIFKKTKNWDYEIVEKYWVGGRFVVSNFSNGYHGILQQWWEYYNKGKLCLLITENNKVKSEFKLCYPDMEFYTLDYYDNKGEPIDIEADICSNISEKLKTKFDLIVCQATLEHLYNPFKAMENMMSLLNKEGVVVLHTHLPTYYYHPYPRDYIRFHPDWFEDIPLFIPTCEMLELYTVNNHVFAAYRKIAD